MPNDFKLQITDAELVRGIDALIGRVSDASPAMREIGELMIGVTKARFARSSGPDGQPWAPNSEATILDYLGEYRGSYNKAGKLSKAGAGRVTGKKPLVGKSKTLSRTIRYQLVGRDGVEWGSDRPQAAMMQFGGTRAQFPHLWGDIPARPYLGMSEEDRGDVLDILARHYESG